ncbi:hypothetical protein OGATHE_003166 [Ogataea polymorpha]|uniref:Uncharacterized protein n=1 Tax=Ogataea polymorpha TaxID=460523 RepID=A0A9P8P8D0_9ASCO|nr:hypothetical protein OGATHE_003166 [Ogataea polymorpha]
MWISFIKYAFLDSKWRMYSVAFARMLALFSFNAGVSPSRSVAAIRLSPDAARSDGTASRSSRILLLMFIRYFFSTTLCECRSFFDLVTFELVVALFALTEDVSDMEVNESGDDTIGADSLLESGVISAACGIYFCWRAP